MKTTLQSLLILLLGINVAFSQDIIYDWETAETTTEFFYFGSSISDTPAANIANPNPTGVNQSSTVVEYIKAADSETWAGAYASPQPIIDVTNGGQICIDVHYDHIGVLALKLEQSSTGGPNWITTQENTVVNDWETICFDLSALSIEEAPLPAAGHVYGQIVLFPDFGSNSTEDETYYLDNIVYNVGDPNQTYDVTFSVNMGDKTDFTTVYLSGAFNEWSDVSNPMSDDDGDNVWETTVNLGSGPQEYKFQLDGWTQSETLDASDVCTITTEDGEFTNRIVLVSADVTMPVVCYESCYDCGQSVNITWNLNMSNESVSDLGVYVAGGVYFGHAELPSMTDEDGDGIYTITLEREIGFTTDYTFLNGICLPNWECKENIGGQDCAVGQFNDRNLPPVMEDTEINTCFGFCSDDGSCGGPVDMASVTFRVDASDITVGDEGLFVSGLLINGWSPDATPMTDADGDNVYEATVDLAQNSDVEFKFVNSGAYEDVSLDDCTIQDASGQFINRILYLGTNDTILPSYLYESCEASSVGVDDLSFDAGLFQLNPSVADDYTNIAWEGTDARTVAIYSVSGQLASQIQVPAGRTNHSLDLSQYENGLYIVRMMTETKIGSQKLIIGN